MLPYQHFLIILSSPSGAGKSTLSKMLLDKYSNINLSTSATTRNPRNGEKNGFHYHFLSREDFKKKIENDEFLEYATVFENFYGTLKSDIKNKFDKGNDVLLDIDWQGNLLVSKQITDKKQILRVFILPPSISVLSNRLNNRGTDSIEVINKRMAEVKETIKHYLDYDFVIINDDLNLAFEELSSIIVNKRIENIEQIKLNNFVEKLLKE